MKRKDRVAESIIQKKKFEDNLNNLTDMELVKLLGDSKLINHIERIFIQNLEELKPNEFKKHFEGLSEDSDIYFYVWVGLTKEDTVVVIGRSSFSKKARTFFGDLFRNYSIWGQSVTQEIILNIIEPNQKKYLEDLNTRLNNFITKAIIVPLDVSSVDRASKSETEIGNYLISSEVPILNVESHKKF